MYRYLITLAVVTVLVTPLDAAQFVPQNAYRGVDDSPFHDFGVDGTLLLEDFEDGELNIPGVSQVSEAGLGSSINVIGHGFSVAADVLDGGLGRALEAHPTICATSYPLQCPARVIFEFNTEPFGILPTFVGFAWTDAVRAAESDFHPHASVKVVDANGAVSQSSINGLPLRQSLEDSHSDDIFVGFINDTGISRLEFTVITNGGPGGHLAIDHLQMGVASLPGDADRNGKVELNDFLTVSRNFATPEPANWASGDFNFDRRVNFPDFVMLAHNWGRELVMGGMAAVPEPTSGVLAMFAILAVFGLRRGSC